MKEENIKSASRTLMTALIESDSRAIVIKEDVFTTNGESLGKYEIIVKKEEDRLEEKPQEEEKETKQQKEDRQRLINLSYLYPELSERELLMTDKTLNKT